jgi:prepilin-type N-terminal cleavage/methylation domain-containing protein
MSCRSGQPHQQDNAGFSMVELLVVVALIALIGLFAIPGISNVFKVSLKSSTRDIATTIKETYNATAMTKRVHRLVYDIQENTYWVESGPNTILLETEESKEKASRIRRYNGDPEKEKEEKEKRDSAFSLAKNVTRKPIALPRGVEFEDVSTEQSPDAINEEKAYTHFFPNGMIEQTVVHLKDNSNHRATLVIQPLVGRSTVYDRYVSKEEALKIK